MKPFCKVGTHQMNALIVFNMDFLVFFQIILSHNGDKLMFTDKLLFNWYFCYLNTLHSSNLLPISFIINPNDQLLT